MIGSVFGDDDSRKILRCKAWRLEFSDVAAQRDAISSWSTDFEEPVGRIPGNQSRS